MQTNKTDAVHRTHIEKAYITIWPYHSTWRSCPCTSSLVAADEHFHIPQEGIRIPAGRDCQVVRGKHGPLSFRMILECHRALTGMPPFVTVMEEGRYGLWRLRVDDDDGGGVGRLTYLLTYLWAHSNMIGWRI